MWAKGFRSIHYNKGKFSGAYKVKRELIATAQESEAWSGGFLLLPLKATAVRMGSGFVTQMPQAVSALAPIVDLA